MKLVYWESSYGALILIIRIMMLSMLCYSQVDWANSSHKMESVVVWVCMRLVFSSLSWDQTLKMFAIHKLGETRELTLG